MILIARKCNLKVHMKEEKLMLKEKKIKKKINRRGHIATSHDIIGDNNASWCI